MVEKQKILFCGDVEGRFNTLFNRVEVLNKKSGPFDMLLCVGNFFGINNKEFQTYKSKLKLVSVPTYILGPNNEDHLSLYPEEGSELCPNVTYLGRRGLYTNSGGIKIAYLSGIGVSDSSHSGKHTFTTDDILFLHDACKKGNSNFKGIDILITSQWPKDINKYDSTYKLATSVNMHSDLVSWVQLQLRPRYHIAGLEGLYYERPPYRILSNSDNDSAVDCVTRFLGLGRVGNPTKDKWLYALSLTPLDKMNLKDLLQKTTDESSCPFDLQHLETILFKNKRKTQESRQYFYDMNTHPEPNKDEKKPKRSKVVFDNSTCWFCLANPAAEKHLVITVGNLVYIALAKGGLVDDHLLICPVEHHQSSVSLSEAILDEVEQFKKALVKMYGTDHKVPVFFERNFKTAHMQIQAVPIPKAAAKELVDIFKDEAEGHGFKLQELNSGTNLNQIAQPGTPYFSVDLPSGEVLYTTIQRSMNFPMNFGREVLASEIVLNLPNQADWRDCTLTDEKAETLVKNIRAAFAPFDFTL